MNPLSNLLTGRDRWTGAACVGRWKLFDPRQDKEPEEDFAVRVVLAQGVCSRCPIRVQCHATAQNARPADRAGVWAGIAYDHRGNPVRIPQEDK